MTTPAGNWVLTELTKLVPLRSQLSLEIFTDPVDAEVRYKYWQKEGYKNLWLHLVRQTTVDDMRQPLTVNIPLASTRPQNPVYVLVRLV